MNFPNIIEETCPTPEATCLVDETPPVLILEPSTALRCAPGTLQFKALLKTGASEVALTAGVTFSSSSSAILSIDASTGAATALAEGIVTVTAAWSGQRAFSQVTVMGGGNCCAAVCVQTIVLQDTSKSMGQTFSGAMKKGDVARQMVNGFAEALLSKDAAALVSFDERVLLRQELTSSVSLLESAEAATPTSTDKLTDLAAAFDEAFALLSVAPLCAGDEDLDVCVPLHGHGPPSSETGQPGDTYVDDDNNGLYWKSSQGWFP